MHQLFIVGPPILAQENHSLASGIIYIIIAGNFSMEQNLNRENLNCLHSHIGSISWLSPNAESTLSLLLMSEWMSYSMASLRSYVSGHIPAPAPAAIV